MHKTPNLQTEVVMAAPDVRTRSIVVAIDESDHSFYALEWALNTLIPQGNNDTLILLHAKTHPSHGGGPGYFLTSEVVMSMTKARERNIENFMNSAFQLCQEKKVKAEVMISSGDPRDVICDTSEQLKADFLVMGSHGYGAIKRAVLGSVSDYCVHHAKCPVVIVRKPHKKANQH